MFKRRNGVWSVVSLLTMFALLVSACTQTTQPAGSAVQADPDGEIVTNLGIEPDSIDPHKASFDIEIGQAMKVFEGLMTLDPKSLKPIPGSAAKEPEISSDGLKWKFTLRDGLKFSDGSPLTAKDFAYGFTRTCDPATASDYVFVLYIVTGCEAWSGMDLKKSSAADLKAAKDKLGIKVLSDKELEFTLTDPAAYFMSIAYMWVGVPAKESEVTKGGDKWTEPATYIGNGPFKLTEWKHNEKMVFERNTNFRLPVKLKKWTNVMISEGAVAFAAYRNNELDALGLAAEDLRTVGSDPELTAQVVDLGAASTYYLGFNVSKPPFTDPNVRLAFAKGFDREAYVRDVQKIAVPANGGFIPPGLPGYDPEDKVQKYDLAEAKKLLDQATPAAKAALSDIKFTYGSNARAKTRVEWFQQQFKQNLGVDVVLDPVDRTAATAMMKKNATVPQLFILGWGADFPDQQNWLTTVFSSKASSAPSGYKSKEFDDLVFAADKERDTKKRDDLYQKASRILSKDAPVAWLYYASGKTLRKPWLKGVVDSSIDSTMSQFRLYDIYVTKH